VAHFAKLDEDNIVLEVLVVPNEVLLVDGEEIESLGISYLSDLLNYDKWVQTSYNNNFRKRYAGIGMKYYTELDAFGAASPPYPSWIFDNNEATFVAPVPIPAEGIWFWSEDDLNWVEEGGE